MTINGNPSPGRVKITSKVAPDQRPCALPFTQLFLNPNGLVTPCCYLSQDPWYVVGDVRRESLEKIWNSEKMKSLRREFLSGKIETCKELILASKCSALRQDLLEYVTPREEMPFPMVRLDLMLNGKCNLECVMCGVWPMPNGVYDGTRFWEEARENIFPYVHEIDIKGGEPFIQRDFYRLVDEVSALNPDCKWHLTTNGHYRFSGAVEEAISKIGIVNIGVSIDSLNPETFARIRRKGDLSRVLRTLDDLIAYWKSERRRLQKINVNFVLQEENWRELPAIYDFCKKKGIGLFLIILTSPAALSVIGMSLEARVEALKLYLSAWNRTKDPVFYRAVRPLFESLPTSNQSLLTSEFESTFSLPKKSQWSIAEIQE